jgi:hypothetical protein
MKMPLIRNILASAVGAIALSAQAVPITGNYGFSGGTAVLDTSSVNTATLVSQWIGPITVGSATGDLVAIDGAVVTLVAPWSFVSGPVANFWTAGGFSFSLTSSFIANQGGGFLNVSGTGILTGGAFDPTAYTFNFSAQDPSTTLAPPWEFTFSASGNPVPTQVPDGGTTALLLGVSLVAVGVAFRRFGAIRA